MHPQTADEALSSGFQDIAEAHSVLSDTSRKRAYDEQLTDLDAQQSTRPATVESQGKARPKSIFDDTHNVHPSFEALYERLLRNFTGRHIPKGERAERLTVEVVLDPDEGELSSVVPVGIPVYQHCPVCSGMGSESFFPCLHCQGRGVVEEVKTLAIDAPARVAAGSMFEASLESFGIHNFFLRIYVSVSR
jgi:DnaJ-class molecular chaperone